ncbi:MAG: hypothetical protein ABR611_02580 [Chthoniobacterales bacterium]
MYYIKQNKVTAQEKKKENRGGPGRGQGRKKWLKASELRRRTAILRLTDSEKSALWRAARQAKKTILSEWMRETLLEEASAA